MMKIKRLFTIVTMLIVAVMLTSCSKTTENEHLPEYCRTYSGFMEFASPDMYELVGGINRINYLSVISVNELSFNVYEEGREIDLDGIQCFQNLTSLSLEGTSFKDISPISALKNIQHVSLISTNVVNISSFKNLSKVNQLTISDTKTLQSVEGVEEMTKLTNLDLSGNGIVNIEGLNNLTNLNTLNLSNNRITYFPSINLLKDLETLDVSNNKIVQLGEDLSGLSNLEYFIAHHNEICDLSTLDDLENLVELDLGFNDLGCNGTSPDFSSLENATMLNKLYLNDNNLTSISDLDGRNLPLTELQLQNNLLNDIAPIRDFTALRKLDIYNNNIININDLSGMINLTRIDLHDNNIVDFSNLRTIPDLLTIDLSSNNITFIPDISDSWPSLIEIDLSSNVLTDTSGIEGHENIQTLRLYNNGLTTLSGISNLPSLTDLVLYPEDDPDIEEPVLEPNPNLISILINSYNNNPLLDIYDDDRHLDLGYEFGPGVEIYGSFNDDDKIELVDLHDMDINVIDEFSFNLINLEAIYVQDNNISDISFILGNPELRQIDLSRNPVNNLTIINGTLIDDLDNLEQIRATGITGDNLLDTAFVGLPDLNFIDLTDTSIISISNSFNDLDEVSTLLFSGASLQTIDNSFNNIFASYRNSNDIVLNEGALYSISNSFNNGLYDTITIQDNNFVTANPSVITGSFNNIEVRGLESIVISGNTFVSIDDSFNTVVCDNLYLVNNKTETISNTFDAVDVGIKMNLQNNELSTLDLSTVVSIRDLDISNNALTTVSFIDGIPNLESLDISNQLNSDDTIATLQTIDGINNMVSLEELHIDGIPITSIDGFKNIGISTLDLSYTINNNILITSISSSSFEGSLLTELELSGHQLNNIDFLSNFSLLESLSIGLDIAGLSDFVGLDIEDSLLILEIENNQDIVDFASLSGYDSLEEISIDSPTTTSIMNLDGLDSLSELALVNIEDITTINNSFNTMNSLIVNETYLESFTSLTNVNNSFDIYGLNGLFETVEINGDITLVNSFNNVVEVKINNGIETIPNYDSLSFDLLEELTFTNPQYDSLAFVSNYSELTSLTIENLDKNISDLSDSSINSFEIQDIGGLVNSLEYLVNPLGVVELATENSNTIIITSNNVETDFDLENSTITLNTSQENIAISGITGNLIINGGTLTNTSFNSYSGLNGTINADNLSVLQTNRVTGFDLLELNINTLVSSLNIDVETLQLNVINDNLETFNITSLNADVYIDGLQSSLNGDITANGLLIDYSQLESMALSGDLTSLDLQSVNLDSLDLGSSVINNLSILTNEAVINYQGVNVDTVSITSNMAANSSLNFPGSVITINNNIASLITMEIIADSTVLEVPSITSAIFSNNSNITTLDLNSGISLSSLLLGTSTLDTINIDSDTSVLSVSGTHNMTIDLNTLSLNDLTVNAPSSNVTIDTNTSLFNTNLQINNITMDGLNNLETLNIDTSSTINNANITSASILNDISTGNAFITTFDVNSVSSIFTYFGINTDTLILEGDNFTTLDITVSNDFVLSSNTVGTLGAKIISATSDLSTNSTIINIDDTSIIDDITITSDSLTNLSFGNANISTTLIETQSGSLITSATQIDTMNVVSDITALNASIPLLTTLTVSTENLAPINIETTSQSIQIEANSDVTITSNTLDTIAVVNDNNAVSLLLSKPALDLNLSGVMASVEANLSNLETITFGLSTIDTITINNTNVSDLDFTNTSITNLFMESDEVVIDIIANTLTNATLNTPNLTTLNTTSPSAIYDVTTNTASLTVNGSINELYLDSNNLTSLTLGVININQLDVESNVLSSLNTNNIVEKVTLSTLVDNFDLITSADTINFTSLPTYQLNITSNASSSLTTNVKDVNITGTITNMDIDGLNIETIEIVGTIDTLIASGNINSVIGSFDTLRLEDSLGSGLLTLVGDSNNLFINNNTITSLNITGILGIASITGDSITTVDITGTANQATITGSNVSTIDVNGSISTLTASGNISSVSGEFTTLNLQENLVVGIITLDVIADSVNINNNTITNVLFTGLNTIDNIDVTSTSLINVETNDVVIESMVIVASQNNLSIDSKANSIEIENLFTGEISYNIKSDSQVITDYASDVTFTSSTLNDITYHNLSLVSPTIEINDLDVVVLHLSSGNPSIIVAANELVVNGITATTYTLSGEVENATISGVNLTNITSTGFIVNNKITINNSLINNLQFASLQILNNVNEIEINTLSTEQSDIENLITILEGTGIILISPVTDNDILTSYYNDHLNTLTNQESIDSVRYDSLYNIESDEALAIFRTSTYFDYLSDAILENEIELQTYQTSDQYLDGYAVSIGYTDSEDMVVSTDYTQVQVDAIETEIITILGNAELTIDTALINTAVTNQIEAEAIILRDASFAAKGFTIG